MPPSILDNPVWHSLHTTHAGLREQVGGAVRFPPEVSIFGALPDEPAGDDWGALRTLVGPGGTATLFRDQVREPEGWDRAMTVTARQMVADSVDWAVDPRVVELGPGDVGEMLALVAATRPGPFGPRTIELGGYVGVRDDDGRLVAMAGHRLRVPGFVEISAVCTADAWRGRGLGSALVRHVVARARERGDTAFLHVASDNVGAVRLYEALGFVHRGTIEAAALRAPGPPSGDGAVALEACAAD